MKNLIILVLFVGTVLAIAGGNHSLATPDLHGEVVWCLVTDKDYLGPVQSSAVDPEGKVTYLATTATLYAVKSGKVEVLSKRPEKEARVALAPGGGVYAWLLPHSYGHGLFYVRLFDISGNELGDLKLDGPPYGFSTLYLGTRGKLILTASPLDDWHGIKGRHQFNFWDKGGKMLRKVVLSGKQAGIVGADGEMILLLGEQKATAFSASGRELRQLRGRYRKAAVAKEGKLALLNPSSPGKIKEVHIYKAEGDPMIVDMPTPVHDLVLTPDGSRAVVVGDQGRYFLLDPSTGNYQEGARLPFEGAFYIMDVKFVDPNTLAMGILHREGEPPKVTWPRGSLLVTDLKGKVIFREDLLIQRATAGEPQMDVAFGSRFIVGYTKEKTLLIALRQ